MTRQFNHEIIEPIRNRWSPRAFSAKAVDDIDILALMEAARYAPSCFNEQPWRFIIARQADTLEKARSALTDKNRRWANRAPVLIIVLARKNFEKNHEPNHWHTFDAGTAWGFLALEAQHRGLITHAMAGFSPEAVRNAFSVNDEYTIVTIIAVGYMGDRDELPEDLREKERPGTRKSLAELVLAGL